MPIFEHSDLSIKPGKLIAHSASYYDKDPGNNNQPTLHIFWLVETVNGKNNFSYPFFTNPDLNLKKLEGCLELKHFPYVENLIVKNHVLDNPPADYLRKAGLLPTLCVYSKVMGGELYYGIESNFSQYRNNYNVEIPVPKDRSSPLSSCKM